MMENIITLKDKAKQEIYEYIDKNIKPLPKNDDGSINEFADGFNDNDVDALRHAYVSGAYACEFGEDTAEVLGRLQEFGLPDSSSAHPRSTNMDLWNNAVGRRYGKKLKVRTELLKILHEALNNGELIITPNDTRDYKGESIIKRKLKEFVIKVEENKTGANIVFYDVNTRSIMTKEEFLTKIKEGIYSKYSYKTVDGVEIPISKRDRFKFNNLG